MQHQIENDILRVTADTHGAELVSVIDKRTGKEMMWSGDPAVWDWHAPILFPYCGKLKHGTYTLDGKTYHGEMHGFARNLEHRFAGSDRTSMGFLLNSNEETRSLLPREFTLESTFSLDGSRLRHTIRVINEDSRELRFGFGYHPAFAFPFDDRHTTKDYELRFDVPQTPIVLENIQSGPDLGFVSGGSSVLVENSRSVPLNDRMFDQDSICMSGLTAKTLSIVEKDTGRAITLRIDDFPYVLIWSMQGTETLKLLCIEPWHCLQDRVETTGDWDRKPCAAVLAPGESWQTELDIDFDR